MLYRITIILSQSYLFVVTCALLFGLLASEVAQLLAPFTIFFLGVIFFLSTLSIDAHKVLRQIRQPFTLILLTVLMLVVFPVGIYLATQLIYPALAIPFLLLAAMPSGMTAPFLAHISGGRQSLALVATLATSLLAPFTVPLVIEVLAGATVDVDGLGMFISLVEAIMIPFALAQAVRRFAPHTKTTLTKIGKPVSFLMLGLLVAGIVANHADTIISGVFGGSTLVWLGALFVLFILFHILGYAIAFWRDHRDRLTIAVCLSYMNFTLAVYLADTFFDDAEIVVPVVLSVIPWVLLLTPFQMIAKRFAK